MRLALRSTALVILATSLAGCGLFGGSRDGERLCPRTAVMSEASEVTRFVPGGRSLPDMLFAGEISDVTGSCEYDRRGVTVDTQVLATVTRGAADRTGVFDFNYFVAVVDHERNILARESFLIRFEFRDDRMRESRVDQLRQRIPLENTRLAPGYSILVGIELTPEDLEYNRSRGR